MTQRSLGLTFFALALALWGVFVFPTARQVVRYYSFDRQVIPDSLTWSSKAINDELWRVQADYSFTVEGKPYSGTDSFLGERYRNPYAAELGIENLKKEHQSVWYAPQNPADSTLEKFFPTKKIVYALITLGLIFYAVWFTSRGLK